MNRSRLKHSKPAEHHPSVVAELRRLAQKHFDIGRQLQLAADRIERGDGLQPVALGEIAERVIARILAGELDDAG